MMPNNYDKLGGQSNCNYYFLKVFQTCLCECVDCLQGVVRISIIPSLKLLSTSIIAFVLFIISDECNYVIHM